MSLTLKCPELHLFIPSPSPWIFGNHWSFYRLYSFTFSKMSYNWNVKPIVRYCVAFSDWFLLPYNMLLREREMATHSSILAWRVPGTEEPGGLPSMGLYRVGHDWSDLAAACFTMACNFINFLKNHWLIFHCLNLSPCLPIHQLKGSFGCFQVWVTLQLCQTSFQLPVFMLSCA